MEEDLATRGNSRLGAPCIPARTRSTREGALKLGPSRLVPSHLSVLTRVVVPVGQSLFRTNTGWLDAVVQGESTTVRALCERTGNWCNVVVYKERLFLQGFLEEDWEMLLRFGKVLFGAACALGVNWKLDVEMRPVLKQEGHIT